MTDHLSINYSYLEQFPDEVFLEIFKYIPLHNLYHGFYKLNQRINNILHSVTELSLTLDKPEDINDEAVCFFASCIYHLIVRHSNVVHFNRFPSLRSLISLFPRDQQLRCIKPKNLSNLTHLTLGFMAIWDCDISVRLCRRIISNKFPKLQYCSLWPSQFDLDMSIIQTPLLTHMELKEGNFDDLCAVINSCPNLKYLQMLVSIYAKAPSKPIESLSVTRLDVSFIRGDPEWIEKLDQLLSLLPNIKRLFIDTCVIHIDFNELSRILKQRLLHLRFFKCEIHAIAFPVLIYNVRRYHPLFENIDLQDIDDNDCRCGGIKLCLNGQKKE
ncbi:unnamed protein product [Rotaria sp. Silwood1]|nr:unnamed protein product [Rotaria sp. Silwood1]CAF0962969.1 unnamed protein product [Rotaria sp. Silwood1]CAF3361041.1 unnamed protein product [Rotaria sp. Silwood1]CAF4657606.1 unnamed protein product [Rotaria sp. Silwood1]